MSRHRRRALWPRVVGALSIALAALFGGGAVGLLTAPATSEPSSPEPASAPSCADFSWTDLEGRTWHSCAPPPAYLPPNPFD